MSVRLRALRVGASWWFLVNAAHAQVSTPAAQPTTPPPAADSAAPATAPVPPEAAPPPAASAPAHPGSAPAHPVATAPAPAEPVAAAAAPTTEPATPDAGDSNRGLQADAVKDDGDEDDAEQEARRDKPHEGFLANLNLGLGYGAVRGGSLGPEPGFRPVDDLSFSGPVFAASLQVGGGVEDFALAAELLYEAMLTDKEEPDNVGFQLFGVGVAARYYTDDDYFLGAQLRYLGMVLWREGIACFWDRAATASGPGVGLTLGKEWYDEPSDSGRRDTGGMGIALQGNYATFEGDADFDYLSVLLQLSMTRF